MSGVADSRASTLAGECSACGATRLSIAVCVDCGVIFEIPTDAYVFFGLTRSWAVDAAALEERYTVLSRAIHEKSAAREELRERAAEAAAALDRARLSLLDPIERARYLLTAYGGSEREKPLRKREFQSEVMEFDRSAMKAREDGDPARLGGIVIEAEEKLASAIMAAGQSFTRLERSLVEEVSAAADAVAEARFWKGKVDELRSSLGRPGK
jgi:DnaJ-domain-containing protein 1